MNLTEEQKTIVSEWAANGAGLSEIQTRLADEFGVRMSYMETRFLILDLGAAIKDKVEEPKKEDARASAANAKASAAAPQNDDTDEGDDYQDDDYQDDDVEFVDDGANKAQEEGAAKKGVSVDMSPITRPGFALTGSAVFSDGVKAEWGITNDGRFALEADDPAYKPSREDLRDFQIKLREIISKRGY